MKRRKKDVAWGFFYTSTTVGNRVIYSDTERAWTEEIHATMCKSVGRDPSPVFRITAPKRGKGRGK